MATRVGVGVSRRTESAAAAGEAWEQARRAAGGEGFVLLFWTQEYDPAAILRAIRTGSPSARAVGCTVAGLVVGTEVVERGVLATVIRGEGLSFHLDAAEGLSGDQRRAGHELGGRLAAVLEATEEEALLLLLTECTAYDPSGFVAAVCERLGGRVAYAGCATGDNVRPLQTYQVVDERVLSDAAVAALILSPKPFGVAGAHGWSPVSPPFIVTRAVGNTVLELDWQNAAEVYAAAVAEHDLLAAGRLADGAFAEAALRYPLGIPQARDEDRYVVRDPIRVGTDGSLTCLGSVPENTVVRLMSADRADMLAAAREAARKARAGLGPHAAAGVLVFYCVSRHLLLGEDCRRELAAVAEAFGAGVPLFGCLAFGEIGAVQGGLPAFHNKSLVVCALPR